VRYLAYLYLLRVPLLVAALVAVLTWQAWSPRAGGWALAHGVFDVSPAALFLVALQATLLGLTLTVLSDTILRHAGLRFQAPPLGDRLMRPLFSVGPLTVRTLTGLLLLAYLAVSLFVVATAIRNGRLPFGSSALAVAGGIGLALALLFGGLQAWSRQPRLLIAFFRWLGGWAGPGYVDGGAVLPGHGTATLCVAIFGALFLLFAFDLVHPATLVSLLNAVLLWTFVLAGASFLFDGFRFPFLIALAALLWLTAQFARSDQYFATHQAAGVAPLAPRDVLEAGRRHDPDRAVVVCAAGGGIQMGAWVTRVLAGLEEVTQGAFSPRVRLVSSVSGGSYGTLYYTASFEDGRLRHPEAVVASARVSSLDRMAFGFVYRDAVRIFLPLLVPRLSGRGREAEASWSDRGARPAATPPDTLLAAWREDARAGRRPAHVFNSVVAETGERFVFSTVDLGEAGRQGRRDLVSSYPGRDVAPVTAARLSAAFPYVGAAARIDAEVPLALHLVDGGYYDNGGVASAVDFLLAATQDGSPVETVLLVEVSGHGPPAASASGGGEVAPARGWFYQAFAPLQALLRMRATAQRSRNEVDLSMLRDVLRSRGVALERETFAFPFPGEPLSWHLTAAEQARIEEAWRDGAVQAIAARVKAFLE
jgi:hypothetical protein